MIPTSKTGGWRDADDIIERIVQSNLSSYNQHLNHILESRECTNQFLEEMNLWDLVSLRNERIGQSIRITQILRRYQLPPRTINYSTVVI